MNTFITSDIHFDHDNIIKYCNRPFKNGKQMTDEIVRKWNAMIGPDDEVWFLGDLSFAKIERTKSIFASLQGRIHLVRGNHDSDKVCEQLPWASVQDYKELRLNGNMYIMCHYPLEVWNRGHHGSFMLHGHSHGSLQRTIPHRIDVGVDLHPEYKPFTMEEIDRRLKASGPYKKSDHHGDGKESGRNEG